MGTPNVTFVPLEKWPRPALTVNRKKSKFSTSYGAMMNELDTELWHAKAKGVVIQIAVGANQIRNDGWPYSTAKPSHPGVILSFMGKHGAMLYPCDLFTVWTDNLLAIARAMEALRMIDRYGVTSARGEQYQGFKALPTGAPIEVGPAVMTVDEAAAFLSTMEGGSIQQITGSVDDFQTRYRRAVKLAHPDTGNYKHLWNKLQIAAEVLKKHHGIA